MDPPAVQQPRPVVRGLGRARGTVCGVYGMNFDHIATAYFFIHWGFRRNGWP
ncbi:hypothetical protein [Streptomyces sp. NPDC058206]|uniref:hypothetical protein n=1 Tax=Streptomyces sp. NPDC058206 TaxID=3346382 RepID=UPI0036EF9F91